MLIAKMNEAEQKALATKNIRLALFLGGISVAIYIGFFVYKYIT